MAKQKAENAEETVVDTEQESSDAPEQEFNDGIFEQETPVVDVESTHEVIGKAIVVNEPVRDVPKVRHPVLVGCKLPHGLTLEVGSKRVILQGLNKIEVIGAKHKVNYVPEDFWEAWKAANPKFPALVSGAIFEGKNDSEISGKAKDFSKRLTGFERMQPDAMGVTKAED